MDGFFDTIIDTIPKRGRPFGYDKQQRHERYKRDTVKEPKQWNGKTYGEVWIEHLTNPDFFKNEDFTKAPKNCPKRMQRSKAIIYYKAKLQLVWDEIYPVKPKQLFKS